MNPTETSSIATYYPNANDDDDGEEQKEKAIPLAGVDVTLKDIDAKIKDILIEKVLKLHQTLKAAHSDTRFQALFMVDEMVDVMEKEGTEESGVTQFFKHSNQQTKIIVSLDILVT